MLFYPYTSNYHLTLAESLVTYDIHDFEIMGIINHEIAQFSNMPNFTKVLHNELFVLNLAL